MFPFSIFHYSTDCSIYIPPENGRNLWFSDIFKGLEMEHAAEYWTLLNGTLVLNLLSTSPKTLVVSKKIMQFHFFDIL